MSSSLSLSQRDSALPVGARPGLLRRVSTHLRGDGLRPARHLPVLAALFVIAVIGWHGSDVFLTQANLTNLLQRVSALGVIAAGTAALMIAGEIDLSIGAAVSVISIIVAKAVESGLPTGVVIIAAVGVGLGIGLVLGLVITFTRAPAFMVTLGALSILAGIGFALTDGQAIVITGFDAIGTGKADGVPISVLILIAANAVLAVLLYRTTLGRSIFAVGGNAEAARLAGIPVALVRVAAFCINGCLVGLGAALLASNVGSGGPDLGTGLELQVIAAVVIGGATLAGGDGSLVGAFLGVVLLGTITNVLNLVGAQAYVGTIIFGAFIVLAVGLRGERAVLAASKISGTACSLLSPIRQRSRQQ
jgi:ribose transport system permease protein